MLSMMVLVYCGKMLVVGKKECRVLNIYIFFLPYHFLLYQYCNLQVWCIHFCCYLNWTGSSSLSLFRGTVDHYNYIFFILLILTSMNRESERPSSVIKSSHTLAFRLDLTYKQTPPPILSDLFLLISRSPSMFRGSMWDHSFKQVSF